MAQGDIDVSAAGNPAQLAGSPRTAESLQRYMDKPQAKSYVKGLVEEYKGANPQSDKAVQLYRAEINLKRSTKKVAAMKRAPKTSPPAPGASPQIRETTFSNVAADDLAARRAKIAARRATESRTDASVV